MSNDRDSIQTRLLSNIDDTYNKNKGEFIYDAEMPVAIELESTYTVADGLLDKRFASTATGKDLDRIVAEEGLTRKVTTQATGIVTVTGVVGSAITKGELVASDSINFKFTESIVIPSTGSIDVEVICESYGVIGNVPTGAIKYFPKTLQGLQTVINVTTFTNGYNEESDESLRARYYSQIQTPATSANKAEYKNWALSVQGCGGARVQSLWNGNGTVKVVIVNSNMRGADSTLVEAVKNYIDPTDGLGDGKAPIGATCTVVSATEKKIDVTANIVMVAGFNLNNILSDFKTSITEYLQSMGFNTSAVSLAKIADILFNTNGVSDYSELKINGTASNITLLDTEIAIIGTVILGV